MIHKEISYETARPTAAIWVAQLDIARISLGDLPDNVEVVFVGRHSQASSWFATAANSNGSKLIDPSKGIYFGPEVICMVWATSEGRGILEDLSNNLKEISGDIQDIKIVQFNNDTFYSQIAQILIDKCSRTMIRTFALTERLSVLRNDYTRLMADLTSLETYVVNIGDSGSKCDFEWRPVAMIAQINSNFIASVESLTIIQRLPGPSPGLAAIEISIWQPLKPGVAGEHIQIELWSKEDDEELACWQVTAVDLIDTWISLALPRALSSEYRTLEIRFTAAAPILGRIAIGAEYPDERYGVTLDEICIGPPLAMRLWRDRPGSLYPIGAGTAVVSTWNTDKPKHSVAQERYQTYSPGLFQLAVLLTPVNGANFTLVSYWPEQGGLLVHPLDEGMTVVKMPHIALEFPKRFRILVEVAHNKAADILFAAVYAPDDSAAIARLSLKEQATDFSGWVRLAALQTRWLTLIVTPRADHRHCLFLATRMAPGKRCHHAWAIFKRIDAVFEADGALDSTSPIGPDMGEAPFES